MSQYEKPITVKSEHIVVAVELKEGREPAIQAGIEKLFGTDLDAQFTQYKSFKIWHRKPMEGVMVQQAEDEESPPIFPNAGVVAARNYLFVSTNWDYLKVILDRVDASAEAARTAVGNEAEYKEVERIFSAMGLTNKPRFFQFFSRSHETLRPAYETLRRGQMAQSESVVAKLLNEIISPDDESGVRRQMFDGSMMPEFDKVQHYFGKAGIYGVTEENGFFIKGFTLKR
jgi:hypothetical protein